VTVVREIPWRPSANGGALGRHVEHDPASRAFQVTHSVDVLKPALHVRHGKILDQGDLGSCTGNAITGCLMTGPLYRLHHNYGEATAVSIYSRATVLDGFDGTYPPDDTGSSGLAVCKVALERGLIRGYETAFGIDQALAGLQLSPIITGVNWYSGFDNPAATGLVKLSGSIRGGHEFLVRAYDDTGSFPWSKAISATEPLVLCDNSWTGTWGLRGSFVMTVEDWTRLLSEDGDAMRPLRLVA
jgi:hypothetical protein